MRALVEGPVEPAEGLVEVAKPGMHQGDTVGSDEPLLRERLHFLQYGFGILVMPAFPYVKPRAATSTDHSRAFCSAATVSASAASNWSCSSRARANQRCASRKSPFIVSTDLNCDTASR